MADDIAYQNRKRRERHLHAVHEANNSRKVLVNNYLAVWMVEASRMTVGQLQAKIPDMVQVLEDVYANMPVRPEQ